MDAYHFKVRIELFGDSAVAIIADKSTREEFRSAIGRIARNFNRANKRIMKYRNFVVHGPKNRVDEFALLRGLELGGIFLHDDLWLTYNEEFEIMRAEWATVANELIRTMECAIAEVQLLNENAISNRLFTFLNRNNAQIALREAPTP